jgi:uncharacterized protein (TIGR04168 family)
MQMPEFPSSPQPRFRLAVVGDVHDQWGPADGVALERLGVDGVIFVGDFGNEAIDLVAQVADIPLPKAVAPGNHDAWYSATPWGRKKCPYDPQQEDWVQRQLDLLEAVHVGYRHLDFPAFGFTAVGGRPFSWGGPKLKYAKFYRERFGVTNLEESTARIIQAVDQARFQSLIFVSHSGPAGLGREPEAICGRDWKTHGGDFGDPDLTQAIAHARTQGHHIPLVVFGHMHHSLRHRSDRLRQRLEQDKQGTLYLNAACVPRIRTTATGQEHNFTVVTLQHQQVLQVLSIAQTWIEPTTARIEQEFLFRAASPQPAHLSRAINN